MKVSFLSTRGNAALLRRLQFFGFSVQLDTPENIKAIGAHSMDLVYLIEEALTHTDSWSDTRVRLARAGRYYIVTGRNMGSREIMHAARDGAHDVVDENDTDERWLDAVQHAAQSQQLWWQLYGGGSTEDTGNLVGRSHGLSNIREACRRLGPTNATVLLIGDSGTGKERVAEALHAASGSPKFVPVNVAAIPRDLIESELFGVEKGAYTGAVRSKPGLVEEAGGGTLFLDEIGELDASLQPKLLRFLETRQARRVGSTKENSFEVRVIAATNRDLELAVEQGRFRADLYYRLSEIILKIPPLKHRLEDIPDLVQVFIKDSEERLGKHFDLIEPELISKLQKYDWPGNVRELKQTIDRLAILYDGPVMRSAWWDVPAIRPGANTGTSASREYEAGSTGGVGPVSGSRHTNSGFTSGTADKSITPIDVMRAMPSRKEKLNLARRLLLESDNDLTWVAAQLGIHPTTLYRWRKAGKV